VCRPHSSEDAAIAEWLRSLIANDLYQHVPRKEDRPAIEAFYRNRSFAPIWIRNGAPLPRVREATEFLHDVGADGLDPSDYPRPFHGPRRLSARGRRVMLTNSVVTFARHARLGRIEPARLGDKIQYDPQEPRPSDILSRLAEATDARTTLDSLLPQQPEYKALKAALVWERSEKGATHSGRGAQLRIGQIDTIIANMERWRWLPRDLGAAYVMVNVPDYTLNVVDHGKMSWSTRIVIGKAGSSSTPLFSKIMTRVVVNPAETVGGRGAAGHIRFDIPNKYFVTQGDAPANLFAKNERVHGRSAVLVENAEQYALVLLSIARPEDGFTIESIRRLYGNMEQSIPFKNLIPVHVSYQTAFVDDAGELQTSSLLKNPLAMTRFC
jgi:murein L,D-transpeptidase YcbB/YkuD